MKKIKPPRGAITDLNELDKIIFKQGTFYGVYIFSDVNRVYFDRCECTGPKVERKSHIISGTKNYDYVLKRFWESNSFGIGGFRLGLSEDSEGCGYIFDNYFFAYAYYCKVLEGHK